MTKTKTHNVRMRLGFVVRFAQEVDSPPFTNQHITAYYLAILNATKEIDGTEGLVEIGPVQFALDFRRVEGEPKKTPKRAPRPRRTA